MSGGPDLADNDRAAFGPPDLLARLRDALAAHGLHDCGTLVFEAGEGPELSSGPAKAVMLVGNRGGSFWPAFSAWRSGMADDSEADPLDRWSKEVLRPLAAQFGATVFFPSDPPYQPFQQWAMRAEGLRASPLGLLIHPVYGLWHGYRGALVFSDIPAGFGAGQAGAHPCDICEAKPCLATCPVDAILPTGFDVQRCRSHLARPEGAACMEQGCLARNACPVGREHRYSPEQLHFHMNALKR